MIIAASSKFVVMRAGKKTAWERAASPSGERSSSALDIPHDRVAPREVK